MKKLLLITISVITFGCNTTKQIISSNNKTNNKNICRGNGHVVVIDSTKTVIRLKGVIINNDTIKTQYRYVLAYGSFNRLLRNYNNKDVLFECDGIIPNIFFGEDILTSLKGCVEREQTSYTTKSYTIK
jgi:hypothetical protein